MKSKKQKTLRFLLYLFLSLGILFAIAFFYRNTFLKIVISKVEAKFQKNYNCKLNLEKANFDGFSGIYLSKIVLVPYQKDTLLCVESAQIDFNVFQLVTGDIQIEKLELQNGFVQLIKNENGKNFDTFLKSKSNDTNNVEKQNYAEFVYRKISNSLNFFPEKISLKNLTFRANDMGKKVSFETQKLELKNHQLQTKINVKTNALLQKWSVEGFANPREKKVDLKIVSCDTTQIRIPFLDEKYNFKSSFDNLHLKINRIEMESNKLYFEGFSSVQNLTLNHPKIAKKNVVFKKSSIVFKIIFGSNFIVLDTNSVAQLNNIKIHPYLEYNTAIDTIYKIRATIQRMKAQDFISSLPYGLFSHFEGMQADGSFDYNLNFEINKNKPWKLIFESKLNKQNLVITRYGEANLDKLNSQFIYRANENGILQRPILVGNSNPNFATLDQISPYLKKCVLTSEDPSFMTHKGFINEAFKQSIVKNIRTHKFSRGASTISMQLIKNVFLTREKTISRKLEEILLVYILENNRISSKERMLEVYFNIIEWGPNIYGIGEAAEFYFQKKPVDLNLKECLFLASIVPSPKKFMYHFDENGNQKMNAKKHQEFIQNIMFRRGLLISEDTIGQPNSLNISGRARNFLNIKLKDSIATDSLLVPKIEEFDIN